MTTTSHDSPPDSLFQQVLERLHRNQMLLRQTEELAVTGSWEYDRQSNQFTWSEAMYRLFGLEPGLPVTPDVYQQYATEADQPVARRLVDWFRQGNEPINEVLRIRRPNGNQRVLKIRGIPLPGSADEPARLLGVDWDITEQTETARQLRQHAEKLQAVLDASPAAIIFLKTVRNEQQQTEDFCVAACNQKFANLIGLPISQLLDKSAHELTNLLWGDDTFARLTYVRDTGQSFYEERAGLNGQNRWMALSVTKQDDGVVITGLDITNLRQMQQQREELLRQIQKSARSVDELAALQEQLRTRGELLRTSSHDLRGTLGVIQGTAGLLGMVESDEERAQMLTILQRNVKEMTKLITELLDFSRLEASQHSLQISSFDAAGLLNKLGENMRPMVEGKGLWLHLTGESNLPVAGDAQNVLRMAQNLILNALKHTHQGHITLHWQGMSPTEWQFSVHDSGPGADEQTIDSPGQHAASDTTSQPNEGIDLSSVRQLCHLLRGQLQIQRQPGRGSVFQIVLPRRYEQRID